MKPLLFLAFAATLYAQDAASNTLGLGTSWNPGYFSCPDCINTTTTSSLTLKDRSALKVTEFPGADIYEVSVDLQAVTNPVYVKIMDGKDHWIILDVAAMTRIVHAGKLP